eukprot:CAMPEP_0168725362 /NCGR_PEP_ID=MMETSP0724-20121128/4113_1 /TAXON_ID=265536 /ORGANISM="Amphiprora sp., Strain CCMP467" /LENGTH=448 /DNA_ID=CAMNT_0008772141 /DNA_START=139 /DNA_END=1485 /DNA_ORIENTATION=-
MGEPESVKVHENDVLMGRGGKNNQHSGNEKLRQFARLESSNYRESTKKGKSAISRDLVQKMRDLKPPSRFLKRSNSTGEWEDVGDDIAREKASQVLRDAVALLPEEQEAQGKDDPNEPLPASEVVGGTRPLTAAVTHDELDRKPSAAARTAQHFQGSASDAFIPPASPINDSRKRPRHHYSYPPRHRSYTHSQPYPTHPPAQYPHYGGYGGAHRYYHETQQSAASYARYPEQQYSSSLEYGHASSAMESSPSHYYQPGPDSGYQHHVRRASSGEMSPPPPRPEYTAPHSQPLRHPGAPHHTSANYYPQAPAPGMYSSPDRQYPRSLRMESYGQDVSSPYHDSLRPPPVGYSPPYSGTSPHRGAHSSPMVRRPHPLSDAFRQDSLATQQSARSFVVEGINEFDLIQGDLLESDHENSPSNQHRRQQQQEQEQSLQQDRRGRSPKGESEG